jgi:hypothetical protein
MYVQGMLIETSLFVAWASEFGIRRKTQNLKVISLDLRTRLEFSWP